MKIILLIFTCILIGTIGWADMPHLLKNGNTIDAEQLNENFNYLKENHQTFRVTADSDPIGIIRNYNDKPFLYISQFTNHLNLEFNKDFHTIQLYKDGSIQSSYIYYFRSYNCDNEPYIFYMDSSNTKSFVFSLVKGLVTSYKNVLYYYPPNDAGYSFIHRSMWNSATSTCTNQTGNSNYLYMQLRPNNPQITNIQTYPFPLPIQIDGINEVVIQ